ncbi:DUF4136 domain-containing protein [Hymenobacter taeanensis]|uniref:DUF4136 domain-containing protein n=1 Tax=Hymenobacter taeanensis TaxID=2735321 RepID=A0A6M6BEN5_9BACT|nr:MULTISPECIES: DUF4136 domain-containing protein [Hymenobacter]QJX46318.1 DUF4136 domain-containing protein [Hymenobacter taeanensis]UOQ80176.1 DUF4136 domain-containing protein [Hymenobacter sp. 5414T-23]
MKTSLYAVLLLLIGLLSSCSSGVAVQQKPGVDFSQYRTYDWAKTDVKSADSQNPIYKSSLNDEAIQNAINSEMAKRGIRPVQGNATPDFYLTYHLYIEEAERTVANPPAPGYAFPYAMSYRGRFLPINYGYWYTTPYYNTGYRTETFQEGTMILDVVDARTNNLVWRGSMADPVGNPARIGDEFARSAKDILDKFPVEEKN